jgi:ubiquinone/menaquinone biosynthesis C-methylase UbiE
LFNPENIAMLEMENRRVWEDPESVLGTIEIRPDSVAVDLGCGSGFFTVPLSRKAKKVYGVDVQKQMLELLEAKIRRLGITNIELRLATATDIPLKTEGVDLIVSINTLHEFERRTPMIEAMRRVLRPGGRALIVDFKRKETGFGPPVAIRVSEDEARRLFEMKGLGVLQKRDFPSHYLLVFSKD